MGLLPKPLNTRPVMNATRPTAPTFPVWHPDGHMEMHTREVINDLVRHGSLCATGEMVPAPAREPGDSPETPEEGTMIPEMVRLPWTQVDPNSASERAAQRAAVHAHAQKQGAPGVSASAVSAIPVAESAHPRLNELRKGFSDLGGVPDPTWGVKKLQDAIEAKKNGTSLPAEPEDE